jgi:hypothetical protein
MTMEEPRPGIVGHEPDRYVIAWSSNAHHVPPRRMIEFWGSLTGRTYDGKGVLHNFQSRQILLGAQGGSERTPCTMRTLDTVL